MIHLSQGHLNLLETCPPQFQRVYLQDLANPLTPEKQENLMWGGRFHLLMQQWQLGLPVDRLIADDEEMKKAYIALINAVPEILTITSETLRYAEHPLTFSYHEYILTVIYDLLILKEHQAKILDWKTYLKPEKVERLAKNWQTRLYMYVLAEVTPYPPEAISMTYWFVKGSQEVSHVTFKYDSKQHYQNFQDLSYLLGQLQNYLAENSFPHVPRCQEVCHYYDYFKEVKSSQTIGSIEEVPEIVLD